ncbi:holin [Clostridium sulfidigenes]|uniref:Holin n=1 Tax=Clostridium sulfidigenes TaxID=318464 RepID=A0A084JIE2_9CLOT|nr:phage holin family protein [Clostridium sulfidigenes]KEZ88726.1 holin [Clostridium sulfidigenes]HAR85445.1 holin [Clostridium sp.]
MEIINYITENALILIPVLLIIGAILKDTERVKDKYIPVILLPIGIILSLLVMKGFSADSVVQGILVTGAAVYGNQLIKQISKE